jgi:RNA polymerase sigma-70 factor (ECF subfamily)
MREGALDRSREGAEPERDHPVMRRARAGDLAAVRALLDEHRQALFAIAWGYLGDREEAMDAVQESLTKALRHIRRYDATRPLSAWLARITRNVCLDRLRRLAFRRHDSLDARREAGAPDPRSAGPSPEARLLHGELRAHLRRAIAELRPIEQEVIILRDVLDWPYARIERFLDLGHGTVASLIHRARGRLRTALAPYLAHTAERHHDA